MKHGPIEKFLIKNKFAKTRIGANAIMLSVALANFIISAYLLKGTEVIAGF